MNNFISVTLMTNLFIQISSTEQSKVSSIAKYETHLKIAALQSAPHVIVDEENKKISGIDIKMLDLIAEKLNITYEVMFPVEKNFVVKYDNGSWGGLKGRLINREADMLLPIIFVTYYMWDYADFSFTHVFTPVHFLVRAPIPQSKITAIIRPYSLEVWIGIFLTTFIMGFVLYGVVKMERFPWETTAWSLSSSWWYIFGSLISQGGNSKNFKREPTRLLICLWSFCVLALMTGYSGTLMSFITYPGYHVVPNTFKKLEAAVKKGQYFCGTLKNGDIQKNIFSESSGSLKIFADNMKKMNSLLSNLKEGIHKASRTNFAVIGNKEAIESDAKEIGEKLFIMSNDAIFSFPAAFALKKGIKLAKPFSQIVQRLFETGFVLKFSQKSKITTNVQYIRNQQQGFIPLTVEDLLGPFVLLGFGYGLSVICLIVENVYKLVSERRRPSNQEICRT